MLLTALAIDILMPRILSFNIPSSSIRACSSAVDFSFRSQLHKDVSNPLEYHPGSSRGYDATAAWNKVEWVRHQATPQGPKSFLDNQCEFMTYVAVSIHLLLQFDSDGPFSKNYAIDTASGTRTFRA